MMQHPASKCHAKASAKSGIIRPHYGIDDFGKEDPKPCAKSDVGMLVGMVPRKLKPGAPIKPEYPELSGDHVSDPYLERHVISITDVIHVRRQISAIRHTEFISNAHGVDYEGESEVMIRHLWLFPMREHVWHAQHADHQHKKDNHFTFLHNILRQVSN
jgi:hypothetical protein